MLRPRDAAPKLVFRVRVKELTYLCRFRSLNSTLINLVPGGRNMAQELGVVLAMVATVLAIATWAAPVKHASDSAAAMPPSEAIYRPQHLNLY